MKNPRPRVDFIILGAGKAGTTSLFHYLSQHPRLIGSSKKETNFFSTHPDWKSGLDEYEGLFEPLDDAIYFEASPSYTQFPHRNPDIWEDIYDYNPEMKFIYLVRNPCDRFVSHYMHGYERGFSDLTLEEALTQDKIIMDTSRYVSQIIPFIEKFGREKVLILDFDDFKASTLDILHTICEFLGIDPEPFKEIDLKPKNQSLMGQRRHQKFDRPPLYMKILYRIARPLWNKIVDNSGRSFTTKPKLSFEQKKQLYETLSSEIGVLEKIMDKDLSHWKVTSADIIEV